MTSESRRYFILDVFTGQALSGNPLAVVLDSEGLSDDRMQAIAAEFNLSETVFVHPAEQTQHNAALRIFTPTSELPFAGHPTVGTAVLLGLQRFPDCTDEQDCMVMLEEKIGLVRAGVKLFDERKGEAVFDVPRVSEPLNWQLGSKDEIAAALGLHINDIGFENHLPTVYSAGVPFVMVPVHNLDAIQRVQAVMPHWNTAFSSNGHNAAFVYCRECVQHTSSFHARMFAPGMGIVEDPATGSAAAAFAGAIHHFDKPGQGTHSYIIEQGFEMGRPSILHLELDISEGKLASERLGGEAVIVGKGELFL